ncbi:hypothetical protein KM043_016852 [Ampulex compressa]|nr:hypothetical protein KM043_016852 [Ampulex compressa]
MIKPIVHDVSNLKPISPAKYPLYTTYNGDLCQAIDTIKVAAETRHTTGLMATGRAPGACGSKGCPFRFIVVLFPRTPEEVLRDSRGHEPPVENLHSKSNANIDASSVQIDKCALRFWNLLTGRERLWDKTCGLTPYTPVS